MAKGQVTEGLVMFCNCTDAQTNATLINGTGVDMCAGETLCEMAVTLVNSIWNGINCQATYDYEGEYYDDGILGRVVCNVPIMLGLGLILLAVGDGIAFW